MKTFDQEFGELSEEQQEILAALLAYPTKTAAAKALLSVAEPSTGISPSLK